MKVSVVMATYNGEEYIVEQLDSIINQSYPVDEIIICDDKSTDRTVGVITEYISRKKIREIKLYENSENLGFAENFNKALNLAKGDYIFFSDQDDIWENEKIQIMLDKMDEYTDCKLLCSDYEPFVTGEQAPVPPKSVLKRMPNNGSIEKIQLSKENIYIGALGCCMCMRKEFREWMQPYWFPGWAQDDRCWKLAQCADGCYLLHLNLVRHRLHGNNTATFGKYHTIDKRVKLFQHMCNAAEQMIVCAEENQVLKKQQTMLKKHFRMMELRLEQMEKKKWINGIKVVPFLPYFQNKKSILVEEYMLLKGK